jgi:beta-lactamase class A
MQNLIVILLLFTGILLLTNCAAPSPDTNPSPENFVLDYTTPCNPDLQRQLEAIDNSLREKYGMTTAQTAVGVLDLQTLRLAMIHPDRIEYAASVPKVGILLAYFALNPGAEMNLDAATRHELGLMAKISSNEAAAKFSQQLGLTNIQQVLNGYGFYDASRGGGIWVGKHYGKSTERIGDPVGNNSHAATIRQLLRYYLLLEQGKLVSPQASRVILEILDSPNIPHDNHRFVKGLEGRNVHILRKWGEWEDWHHDSAVITGPNRKYILVALTHHPRGAEYLENLAPAVDNCLLPTE